MDRASRSFTKANAWMDGSRRMATAALQRTLHCRPAAEVPWRHCPAAALLRPADAPPDEARASRRRAWIVDLSAFLPAPLSRSARSEREAVPFCYGQHPWDGDADARASG